MNEAPRSLPLEQVWIARLLRAVSSDEGSSCLPFGSVLRRGPMAVGSRSRSDPQSDGTEEDSFTRHGSAVGC